MEYAALAAWVLAALAGLYLLVIRMANGGLQATKVTRFPVLLVLSHPLVATVGLGTWVLYIATTQAFYAWSAFGMLVVVALLGFVMLTRWLVGHGGRHARGSEQPFPTVAVIVHGAVAVATCVLVFMTAVAVAKP